MYNENAIEVSNLGKMYKIYNNPRDKFLDIMGLNFFKKNYYNEFWAIRDLNIEIKKGEKVGLIGRNGAGKSTFLKTIIGSIQPTEGNMNINGRIQALMELGTGFHPEFTGRENIRAALAYNGLSKQEIYEKEIEIVEFSELEEFIDRPIKTYSAGMLARLGFSTATSIEPEILIIDEVLGAGDAYFTGKCIERMKNITSKNGATILFVSHDLASLQMLCDRAIWIDKGKVVQDDVTLEVVKNYTESIRKSEEARQKAKNMKLSTRNKGAVDSHSDIYDTYLFRIVCDKENIPENKIRKITLLSEKNPIAYINVGDAMDNNKEHLAHIIDDIGLMNWSESKKDDNGYYRSIVNNNSKYNHAPFQFSIEKGTEIQSLEVEGENTGLFKFEIFDFQSGKYIVFKFNECSFEKSDVENTFVESHNFLEQNRDIRFSEKCKINKSEILDIYRKNRTIFSFENGPKIFKFDITINEIEKNELFIVFILFTEIGQAIYSKTAKIDIKNSDKEYTIEFNLENISLGQGEYNISFAVYEHLDLFDSTVEQSTIAIIDRELFFKVEEPMKYKLGTGRFITEANPVVLNERGDVVKCHSII